MGAAGDTPMTRTHAKLILWPQETLPGPLYRYTLVGLVVTDRPLEGVEGEVVIDGPVPLAEVFGAAAKRPARVKVGDAADVLERLNEV